MKVLTAALVASALAVPASATTLRITITNNQADDGFALTPVYSAFHDGNFDPVTVGEQASFGVERLAELGQIDVLPLERTADQPNSTATAVFGDGAPPIFGGVTSSAEIEITDFENQRFFSFLSMVLPSNDLFIANAQADAYNLFNDDGTFVGPQIINVTGEQVYDAGTELNDASLDGGAAFVAGSTATAGFETDDAITAGFSALEEFLGVTTGPGFVIDSDLGSNGFFADASNAALFNIATITIEEVVAPVPLPAGGMLLLSGLGFAGFAARRKAKRA